MTTAATRRLQVALSAVAGFVDAIAFFALGGMYVAFMSGNSTLIATEAGEGKLGPVQLPAMLVGGFVAGVIGGTLVGGTMQRLRPVGVMLMVAVLLAGAAFLCRSGHVTWGGLLLAAGMGAENTVFNRPGHSGVGLTYMTGTLVRIGQGVAEALRGAGWSATVPDVLLWLGMMVGAGLGTVGYRMAGLDGLWFGAGTVLVLSGLAFWATPAKAA